MVYVEHMVAEVLAKVESEGLSLRAAMEDFFGRSGIRDPTLKALMRAFALGLLRNYRKVDLLAESVLGDRYWSLDPPSRNLIRAALYEVRFRGVSVDRGLRVLSALRSARLTRRDLVWVKTADLRELMRGLSREEELSVRFSQPTWLVRYLVKLLGYDEAVRLMRRLNRPATLWLRVNTTLVTRRELVRRLRRRGVVVVEDEDLPDVVRVVRYEKPLANLPE